MARARALKTVPKTDRNLKTRSVTDHYIYNQYFANINQLINNRGSNLYSRRGMFVGINPCVRRQVVNHNKSSVKFSCEKMISKSVEAFKIYSNADF